VVKNLVYYLLFLSISGSPVFAADPTPQPRSGLRLPNLFSDHMVLQRELPVQIWGWADPGEEVTVSVAGQSVSVKTGADGKWKLSLKPLAAADSLELVVKGKDKTIPVKDVAVGEVWMASGQSNMVRRVGADGEKVSALASADDPGLRVCTVVGKAAYTLQDDVIAAWIPSSAKPGATETFSATAYFFARELRQVLKVPVGVMVAAAGGVPGVTYLSPEGAATATDPGIKACSDKYQIESAVVVKWQAEEEPALMATYLSEKDAAKKNKTAMPKMPEPPVRQAWDGNKLSMFYHGQLGPLQAYTIRGTLWNQGESMDGAKDYRALLEVLVADWRKKWNQPDLPFLSVQITGQGPEFHEKQLKFWLATPGTGLAVASDTCTADEFVHARYKGPVGRRLALFARALVYGEKIEYSGPVYDSVKFDGDKAILSFTHRGKGLAAKVPVDPKAIVLTPADFGADLTDKLRDLSGFIIAGGDKKFVPAKAEIKGDTVVVSNVQVPQPAAVRYLWSRFPELWTDTTLYNLDGIPAPCFRTDTWPR